MSKRLELHELLCDILGSRNVYFQPPSSLQMVYPAIRYSRSRIEKVHADDSAYKRKIAYELILIDKNPDSVYCDKILELPYCAFDRAYTSDNLNHFTFTIYY